MKRLLCLFLCLVTLLTVVLTSCSKKQTSEDVSNEASKAAKTISMWMVSENKISPATAAAVSEAVNAITEAKFTTHVVINFFTEDEYRAKLEETILAYEAAKKADDKKKEEVTTENSTETGEDEGLTNEMVTNEFGLSVIKYPELVANQVDIIYIGDLGDESGESMYIDFINNGWLLELDDELSEASKKISEYVSPTLLSAVKHNGTTYAIPNNNVIGEYTYMMLNKELMKKYSQDAYIARGEIDGFYNENVYTFLELVHMFEEDVVPVASDYDFCLDLLAHYWSIEPDTYSLVDEFSIFGHHYTNIEDLTRGSVMLGYNSLFEDEDFTDSYLKLNKLKFDGYFDTAANKEAALKFVTSDSTVLSYNEDEGAYEYVETVNGKQVSYYPVVVKYPAATTDDIYANMFGVYSHSRNADRAMEVVTYMNTNADLRNLLQYGVENTHYTIETDSNGQSYINPISNDYVMDIYSTGNVFLTHPAPEMSPDIWEKGKIQNRNALVDPLLGFDFAEFAASTVEEKKSTSLASVGYNLSYTTGYSKFIWNQNATLQNWLAASDAKGNGVYVLKTSAVEGSNVTYNYYVYNKGISNAEFTVEDIRVTEPKVDEKTGKETQVQVDLDFVLKYTGDAGSAEDYELSVVSIYTRKSNEFELKCQVNEGETACTVTEIDSLLSVDFRNSKEYTVETYDSLIKRSFLKNETVNTWISDKNKKSGSFMMSYVEEKDGQKIWSYLILMNELKYATYLDIVYIGDQGELNMEWNFREDQDDEYDTGAEGDYFLYYIRVTADKDVDVSYDATMNGEEFSFKRSDIENANPDYDVLGMLDTELVKYFYDLNKLLVGKLNACTTYEELETMVEELTYVLNTGATIPSVKQLTLLQEVLTPYANEYGALDVLHTYMLRMIEHEREELVLQIDPETGEEIKVDESQYVFYDTPYGIYYAWLEKYGYLPESAIENEEEEA